MTVYKWSETAATNNNVDATINWTEGQAPSSVNDSARAMMAALKKMYGDVSGGLNITAGTSSAYTLTSRQVFSSLATMNAAMITFTAHATNAVGATLNVDGLGAKNLRLATGVDLPVGTLLANNPYSAVYINASNEWRILGAIGCFPSGTRVVFQQTAAPVGWTKDTTHNDKVLRVVSGSVSSAGSVPFSTFAARTSTDGFGISQANLPSYNLSASIAVTLTSLTLYQRPVPDGTAAQHTLATVGGESTGSTSSMFVAGSGTAAGTIPSGGSGTGLSAGIDCRIQNLDVTVAQKD